jgi:hypothetical protein
VFQTCEEVEDLAEAPGAADDFEEAEIILAASLTSSHRWRRRHWLRRFCGGKERKGEGNGDATMGKI